jgi:hypothetical protein
MHQLDPYLDVITPLGPARAVFLVEGEADHILWLVFIKATGEPWFFRNPYIRWAPAPSDGRGEPSPFIDLPPGLDKHIERYRKNGWLASAKDPSR